MFHRLEYRPRLIIPLLLDEFPCLLHLLLGHDYPPPQIDLTRHTIMISVQSTVPCIQTGICLLTGQLTTCCTIFLHSESLNHLCIIEMVRWRQPSISSQEIEMLVLFIYHP